MVNDHAVQIASTDSLQDIENNINRLNSSTTPTGVTATIIQDSSTTYRLELTSDTHRCFRNQPSERFGFGYARKPWIQRDRDDSIKNEVTGGAQSDSFTSSSTGVAALLGMANSTSGTVTINGKNVAIDLSDTLQTIQSDMVTAGIPASIVSSTSGSQTTYNLQIAGMTSYTDQNNVLQSLGLIQGNRDASIGVTGSVANTTDGSTPITAATDITSIYGYNNYTSGDKITISGTTHNGTAVASTNFAITPFTTVGDLLIRLTAFLATSPRRLIHRGKSR